MDLSQSNSGRRKPRYRIETKSLSYNLPPSTPQELYHQYFTTTPTASKAILRDITCEALPGELLAIVGPSGAGKSTLLSALAGMIHPSNLSSGAILVNGLPIDTSRFRRISGYVTQDDALFPLLTVEEALSYSARLRLHDSASAANRVRHLLDELGLVQAAGTRIGLVSGGERRRVSIGVDLVHDPAVLLLDEPTSGLDSASALHVVKLLKSMAAVNGKTIIISIHQPGFRILELLDRVLLISGGTLRHAGPIDLLAKRLADAGHHIPPHANVLEYAMDSASSLLAVETPPAPAGCYNAPATGCYNAPAGVTNTNGRTCKINTQPTHVCYNARVGVTNSNRRLSTLFSLDTPPAPACYIAPLTHECYSAPPGFTNSSRRLSTLFSIDPLPAPSRIFYANSQCGEVAILAERFFKNTLRTKQLFAARMLQCAIAGLGLGSVFAGVENAQSRVGFFAFSLTFLLSSTTEGLPVFLQERRILMRETSRGAYRVSSYVAANAIVFIPFLLVAALLYATPVYWLVGLRKEVDGFMFFALVVWLVMMMANSFVACFSALVPNFIMGNSVIAGLMGSFFLFSGYFISRSETPKYWVWMHYLSLFKYPFEGFLINEYGGERGRKECVQRGGGGGGCLVDGAMFLREQGLEEEQKWRNVGVMVGFVCVYRVLCFVILWFRCCRVRR